MKTALLVIAKNGYQDVELDGTRKGLEKAGFSITLASTESGQCAGKFGGKEEAEVALEDVDTDDYDRVAFIGGPGASNLWQNKEAQRIAQEIAESGRPLGAICIAPKILAVADVLQGKKATVWNEDGDQAGFLALHGAEYTGELVTIDGMIVTGNGPEAAEAFGKALAKLRS